MTQQGFKDRGALITGGASGIGRATALSLARAGAAVLVMDLDELGGEAVVSDIRREGGRAVLAVGDVSRAVDCSDAVATCAGEFGRLDILCNSAGIIYRSSVVELTEEQWDRTMAVNVRSVYLMSKYAVPLMAQQGGGAIVNIGSGWGLSGGRRAAAYCASKGAVVQLTKAMALDHGDQNIRVNCVCPGDTDTPMLRGEAQQLGEPIDRFLSSAATRPIGRVGRPEDIAEAVLYLASDAAAFVTGTILLVDGGGLAGTG
ncbi:MAG: SDR family oxidoreductase [Gemmatimonadota bacterium]|nr:MAG: SDR family oxidoreductase [Gemmatimonadota bacterium]